LLKDSPFSKGFPYQSLFFHGISPSRYSIIACFACSKP
jgi:hypothetical protein